MKPKPSGLVAVVADGFDRAAFLGFLALSLLLGAGGLFEDVRKTSVIAAGEIGRSGFATEITIDALIINVVFSRDVVGIFICNISHKLMLPQYTWAAGTSARLLETGPSCGAKFTLCVPLPCLHKMEFVTSRGLFASFPVLRRKATIDNIDRGQQSQPIASIFHATTPVP